LVASLALPAISASRTPTSQPEPMAETLIAKPGDALTPAFPLHEIESIDLLGISLNCGTSNYRIDLLRDELYCGILDNGKLSPALPVRIEFGRQIPIQEYGLTISAEMGTEKESALLTIIRSKIPSP